MERSTHARDPIAVPVILDRPRRDGTAQHRRTKDGGTLAQRPPVRRTVANAVIENSVATESAHVPAERLARRVVRRVVASGRGRSPGSNVDERRVELRFDQGLLDDDGTRSSEKDLVVMDGLADGSLLVASRVVRP